MNKEEFLEKLRWYLTFLPEEEAYEYVNDYREMIEDRMEEGLSEKEIIKILGEPAEIAKTILSETPFTKLAKTKWDTARGSRTCRWILLLAGFPIWLPLAISWIAILISCYAVLWSLWLCIWTADLCFALAVPMGIVWASLLLPDLLAAAIVFGGVLICGVLAVLCFLLAKASTKAFGFLSKKMLLCAKLSFILLFTRKENKK